MIVVVQFIFMKIAKVSRAQRITKSAATTSFGKE
jgi:hypothetical protein